MKRMIVGLAIVGFFASGAIAQTPPMNAAEARLLYGAGGFPISADGKTPTNRCGTASRPRITFVDMNADGRKEALFIDGNECYAPDNRWYAVTTQAADGSWRRILEGQGIVQTVGTIANGWFVLNATSGGKQTRLYYDGAVYGEARAVAATGAKPGPGGKPAAGAIKPAAAAPKPALKPPTAAAKPMAPMPAPLPAPAAQSGAARDATIFRAAGFKQMRGHWESGCNDPSTGAVYDPGSIEQVKDLNGDGRPEAVVVEGSTYCYGNIGTAFWLLSQQANGSWKLLLNQTGIAEFLTTKGVGGMPDILIGGPGFCFPVVRWNGSAYVQNRFAYDGKACRPN